MDVVDRFRKDTDELSFPERISLVLIPTVKSSGMSLPPNGQVIFEQFLSDPFGDLGSIGIFNGNPIDNLIAGARILRGYGSGRTSAGRYRTGTGSFSKTKDGKDAFKARAESYDKLKKGYDAFFNCLRGK